MFLNVSILRPRNLKIIRIFILSPHTLHETLFMIFFVFSLIFFFFLNFLAFFIFQLFYCSFSWNELIRKKWGVCSSPFLIEYKLIPNKEHILYPHFLTYSTECLNETDAMSESIKWQVACPGSGTKVIRFVMRADTSIFTPLEALTILIRIKINKCNWYHWLLRDR